jgi:RNA polymerase sigma factor (sigma-70 family)
MATTQVRQALSYLRRLAPRAGAAAPSDEQLLQSFVAHGDATAFADLVRRHGPLVFGVCRSVLRQEQDAEDAFQATFLVLARRAACVRAHGSVAAWLHGVACRVAQKARTQAACRRRHEAQAAGRVPPAAMDDLTWRELREVFHEELGRLPEKYRAPLLLCYWEGLTQDEAARRLACPKGTLKERLERGRELLRGRLVRRGLAPSAALFAALWSREAADAALSAAVDKAVLGQATARAAVLAEVVLRGAFLTKMTVAAAAVMALVALAAAGALAYSQAKAEPDRPGQGAVGPPRAEEKEPRTDALGDPLPDGAVARLGSLRLYHGGDIIRVALSPDGKLVASTGMHGGGNRLWDAVTGRELELAPALKTAFIFAAKEKLLAAEPMPGGYRLTDLATGKAVEADGLDVKDIKQKAEDLGLREFPSPDGSVIAVREDKGLKLLDGKTRKELLPLEDVPAEGTFSVAFSPDGKLLAAPYVSPVPQVWLWDLSTRKVLRKLKGKDYQIFHAIFSVDGKLVAAADGSGVTFWEVKTGKWVHDFGHTYFVSSLAFTPDGKALLTGAGYTDDIIRLWDPLTGKARGRWLGHGSGVTGLAVTPDGKLAVSSSQDRSARVWDVASGKDVRRLGDGKEVVWALELSPDGKTVATAGKAIRLWDLATGKELRSFGGRDVMRLAFAPDGNVLASNASKDTAVHLWDVATGQELRVLNGHEGTAPCLAFSPDGRLLATGDSGGTVRLWDAATGKALSQLAGPEKPDPRSAEALWAVAFSPDGRTLALGHSDETVRLLEVASGRERARWHGHSRGVTRVAFSPDGTLLASGSWDRTAVVWDVTGRMTGGRRTKIDARLGERLWVELAATDAVKAFATVRALLAAEGAEALLKERLRPAEPTDDNRVARLIAEVDSDDFDTREKAAREIVTIGEAAGPALRKALAGNPSAELRRQAEEALRQIDPSQSGEAVRGVRAVEVLEYLATPDARKVLRELAKGAADARLTREAKASLDRLTSRDKRP